MRTEGDAAAPWAGPAVEGDTDTDHPRQRLLARLARVDEALRQWDAWATRARRVAHEQARPTPHQPGRGGRPGSDQQASAAPRTGPPGVAFTRPTLIELRGMLAEELERLGAEADA